MVKYLFQHVGSYEKRLSIILLDNFKIYWIYLDHVSPMFDRWYTAIKDIFFFVWLFFLFTISMNSITGKNEAIIVELKELGLFFVEWHFYHLFWGLPSLDFSQLQKMMPALAFNFMIAATNAWRGKWNRHAVASDKFFYTCAIFIPRPYFVGGGYCHHHVLPGGRASVFRFRTISLKPLAGLLSYCIHTSLRGCRCAFLGLWPLTWLLTFNFEAIIDFNWGGW